MSCEQPQQRSPCSQELRSPDRRPMALSSLSLTSSSPSTWYDLHNEHLWSARCKLATGVSSLKSLSGCRSRMGESLSEGAGGDAIAVLQTFPWTNGLFSFLWEPGS